MPATQITIEQICAILDGLFGCEKTATAVDPPVKIEDPRVLATYLDLEGEFKFAIACELKLGNGMGAALTMIHPSGAQDATAAGEVPDNIGENLYEVLNICSAVFADFHEKRIVLDAVVHPGAELDSELVDKIDSGECLLQINYELGNYQPGKISLIRIE